ncbi:hypothetical protein [Streptomyces narbonensis]|uniref:hypothetical protein n=1 Tax=Streptomyces narbonensis TaxID=67333 RepID=UPI00198826BC|nr:hypothetical protein [Streptomyces narbonensis]GGW09409.1 hypothetical protein GCM10010230_58670 [Streptomyces narbonensis]
MGVFAVFRRKKKDVVEASSEETGAVATPTADAADTTETDAVAGADAEVAADVDVDACVAADSRADVGGDVDAGVGIGVGADVSAEVDDVIVIATEAAEAPEAGTADSVDGSADADATEGVDRDERAAGAVVSEIVEIPKQQSAEAAADNEAGEGARK